MFSPAFERQQSHNAISTGITTIMQWGAQNKNKYCHNSRFSINIERAIFEYHFHTTKNKSHQRNFLIHSNAILIKFGAVCLWQREADVFETTCNKHRVCHNKKKNRPKNALRKNVSYGRKDFSTRGQQPEINSLSRNAGLPSTKSPPVGLQSCMTATVHGQDSDRCPCQLSLDEPLHLQNLLYLMLTFLRNHFVIQASGSDGMINYSRALVQRTNRRERRVSVFADFP